MYNDNDGSINKNLQMNVPYLYDASIDDKIENILSHRFVDGKKQYLVKIEGKSYHELEWKEARQIYIARKSLLKKYDSLYPVDPPREPCFNQEYLIPKRIITENDSMFLIQWSELSIEESTWVSKTEFNQKFLNDDLTNDYSQRKNSYRHFTADRKKVDYQNVSESEFPVSKHGFKLKDYQVEGVNFLLNSYCRNTNCILADEMGLGKTIQAVTFLNHVFFKYRTSAPFLIIVQLSTILNWKKEIKEWTNLRYLIYFGSPNRRSFLEKYEFFHNKSKKPLFHVAVTTLQYISKCIDVFSRISWDVVVIDEAHLLKNSRSKKLKSIKQLKTNFKLLITGTPLQNKTQELWPLLNYLDEKEYESYEQFCNLYGVSETVDQIRALNNKLRPIMIRRVKSEVEKDLAPIEEIIIECTMTKIQSIYYNAIYTNNRRILNLGSKGGSKSLSNIALELRRVCNHPFLIENAKENILKDEVQAKRSRLDLLINLSGKMIIFDKLLSLLKSEGHRVLVFSQLKAIIYLIEEYMDLKGYSYCRIDGDVDGHTRKKLIEQFNSDQTYFAFLLSTRAGGHGINLASADTVIIFDADYNPQNDIQATSRCHRIGQTKEVKVYRMLTKNSYESYMFELGSRKLGIDHAVLEGGKSDRTDDLEKILKLGAYHHFIKESDENCEYASVDIQNVLANSKRLRIDSVYGEGSYFSKTNFNTNDEEINDPNYWSNVFKKLGVEIENEEKNVINEDIPTKKYLKKVFNAYMDFGVGRWSKIRSICSFIKSNMEVKTYVCYITKWVIYACDFTFTSTEEFKVIEAIYKNLKSKIGQVESFEGLKDEFYYFFKKRHDPQKTVIRIYLLHILRLTCKKCENAPEGLIVPTDTYARPLLNWSDKDDRLLMHRVYLYGISQCKVPNVTEKRLVKRLERLIYGIINMFDMLRLIDKNDNLEFSFSSIQRAKSLWKPSEHRAIINLLLKYGENDEKLSTLETDKSFEAIKFYVSRVYSAAQDEKERQSFFPQPLSQDESHFLMERKILFNNLRKYLESNRNKHTETITQVKEILNNGLPDTDTSDYIYRLKVMIGMVKGNAIQSTQVHSKSKSDTPLASTDSIQTNTIIKDDDDISSELPLKLSKSLIIINLGTIITDRSNFCSGRYIFPVGYLSEKLYYSTKIPNEMVWYINTIIDDGSMSPLFRVYPKNEPDNIFEGRKPSTPWTTISKIVSNLNPSIRTIHIPGAEFYGLSKREVKSLISRKMEKLKEIKHEKTRIDIIDFEFLFSRAVD